MTVRVHPVVGVIDCSRCRNTGRIHREIHIDGPVGEKGEIVRWESTECPDCNEFAENANAQISGRAPSAESECSALDSTEER